MDSVSISLCVFIDCINLFHYIIFHENDLKFQLKYLSKCKLEFSLIIAVRKSNDIDTLSVKSRKKQQKCKVRYDNKAFITKVLSNALKLSFQGMRSYISKKNIFSYICLFFLLTFSSFICMFSIWYVMYYVNFVFSVLMLLYFYKYIFITKY